MLPLIGLAAGMAGGYRESKQHERELARQDKNDAWQEEERAAVRAERQRQTGLQTGLRDAAAPATMSPVEGSELAPDQMGPSLAMYRVKGNGIDQTTPDQAVATKSLADYNAPEAVASRQAGVLRASGAPDKAMSLENAALTQKRAQEQYTQEQADRSRKLKEEGVFEALRAFRAGDAKGLAKAFNSGGEYKIDGTPEVTKEDREIPGVGKIPSYTAKIRIIEPDGQVQEKTYNSHDLTMQMMPYEKSLELMRKGSDSENKANYQKDLLDTKIKSLELAGQVAEARALKAAASGGPVGREERLRYTSLFSDAGRRAGEAQKALTALQKDSLYMVAKEGSPQALEIQNLRDTIKQYNQERSLYQSLLANSQTTGAPGLDSGTPANNPAKPAQASPAIPAPASKAEYDKLPKGSQYRHPSGEVRIKG